MVAKHSSSQMISWQSLETRTPRPDPQYTKLKIFESRALSFESRTFNFQLRTSSFELKTSSFWVKNSEYRVSSQELWTSSWELWFSSWMVWVPRQGSKELIAQLLFTRLIKKKLTMLKLHSQQQLHWSRINCNCKEGGHCREFSIGMKCIYWCAFGLKIVQLYQQRNFISLGGL